MSRTHPTYEYAVTVPAAFQPTVDRIRAALARQGFGILCEIDVQAILRAKLGVETEPYVILGACNPPLAHRALTLDPSIGLLLPCNVVVRALSASATRVEAIDPAVLVTATGNAELDPVARAAARHLRAALAEVADVVGSPERHLRPDALAVDRDRDGAGALHDVEAEAGDEEGLTDLFLVDRAEAHALGVALDPLDSAERGLT